MSDEKVVEVFDLEGEDNNTTTVDVEVRKAEEPPSDQKDIIWAVNTPLDEMSDAELTEAVQRIRSMRTVRMTNTKKRDELDVILAQLSAEKASALLKIIDKQAAASATDPKSSTEVKGVPEETTADRVAAARKTLDGVLSDLS